MGDAWSLAKRTAVGLNEIRKLINVEEKYHQRSEAVSPTQAGAVTYLTNIAQGDDINTREGNSLKVQRYLLSGYITRHADSAVVERVRVMVVRDLQNQGATITGADVISDASTAYAPIAHINYINSAKQTKRFSYIYDEVFCLDEYHPNHTFNFVSNHDCHCYYRNTDSAVTAAANGAYFILLFVDTTSNLPSVNFSSRIEFTDN